MTSQEIEWPREEVLRGYIRNRIARLRTRKRWVSLVAWAVVALGITHAFTSLSLGAAIVGLGLLGWFIALDLLNLYIDLLVSQWRDLDRDLFLNLDGFETPMNVPK